MKDELAFDNTKLNEIIDNLNKHYENYNNSINELEAEINHLELIWGTTDRSIFNDFKDKYNEKSPRLKELSEMIKQLITNITIKNNELEEKTEIIKNNFE